MVVCILIKGHVYCFMPLFVPLHRIADVGFDEIIFPIDSKRCTAVDCNVQLAIYNTCKYKCIIIF